MQTFLPYESFEETAKCLDYRRLGKQRIEAYQIIDLLEQENAGIDISFLPWGNHPARHGSNAAQLGPLSTGLAGTQRRTLSENRTPYHAVSRDRRSHDARARVILVCVDRLPGSSS